MKTRIFTTAAVAVIGFASGTTANVCTWGFLGPAYKKYFVLADGVDDILGKCGGFWDNMNNKNFNSACTLSHTSCEDSDGQMVIEFMTGSGCNGGHVESAWWEATRNNFGAIHCVQK